MKTLIYHYGALGDFITVLPFVAEWKKRHGPEITLLGKPSFGTLGTAAGYFSGNLDAGSNRFLFLFNPVSDPERLRSFFSTYDAIVLFTAPDTPLALHSRIHSTAIVTIQPPFPEGRIHVVDYHLSLLTPVPGRSPWHAPVLSIPETDPHLNGLPTVSEKTVAIHPGSGSAKKNWPFHDYLDVADRLRALDFEIVWLIGPAEHDLTFPPEDTVVREPPLITAVSLCSRCGAFIGNDSGMTHLAAAAGCPVVALFGSSDPAVWEPRGTGGVQVLYKGTSCSPCHPGAVRAEGCDLLCLRRIIPEEVVRALVSLLSRENVRNG